MCSHKQTVGRNMDIKNAATECSDGSEEHSREFAVQMAFKDRERGHKPSKVSGLYQAGKIKPTTSTLELS